MCRKAVFRTVLILLSVGMLTLTLNVRRVNAEPEAEPTYVGVARYYDNRKCVVTSTQDDLGRNVSAWQECLSMFTRKKIYHTVATITNKSGGNDWDFAQYWVAQGYTEAGSHSRNHVHVPYTGTDPINGRQRVSYEWQINGSKNDIIGNLTLPNWWRCGDKEYVYAWIEPYGSCDETVRQWLGDCYYLSDRRVGGGVYSFAGWDSSNGLFNRVGYTVEMGSPPWGGDTSAPSLNSKFDIAHNGGKIYHLITHPVAVNWSEGNYADQHTDYISNRTDVWYVPFGLLYLYHWVDSRNIVNVTSTGSGLNKAFELSIDATDHLNYGVSYPITYVFDIPTDWTSGYVYCRYRETDPWTLMDGRSSEEFFNGIDASRFDFTNHKAYVSLGFSNVSHNIYLQLRERSHDVAVVDIILPKTVVGQNSTLDVEIAAENQGDWEETFNVTTYFNETAIILPNAKNYTTITLKSGNHTSVIFTWNTTGVARGTYIVSAHATPVLGETETTDNTYVDDTITVTIVGDVNGDGIVDIVDLATVGRAFGTRPGDVYWNPEADTNNDYLIDIDDLLTVARNYGKTA